MRIKIYLQPDSKDSFWSKMAIKGVAAEILHKRYVADYIQADSVKEIDLDKEFKGEKKRVLLYIGYSPDTTQNDLVYLAKQGIHTLLLNYGFPGFSGSCSRVLVNYRDGMEKCIGYLTANKHDRIALFGVNPHSSTDMLKDECFAEYLRARGGNPSRDIYYNYGSIQNCFARFSENLRDYNAVICTNDIVAISLLHRLEALGIRVPEDLYIISCSYSTLLAERVKPGITMLAADKYETGVQAVFAYTALVKNPSDIALTVRVATKLTVRGSTNFDPAPPADVFPVYKTPSQVVNFYDDPDAQSFIHAESLLLNCDELDQGILEGILAGETYPSIAERLYTSENVISYRIKRMCKIAGCEKRQELIALLSPFLKS